MVGPETPLAAGIADRFDEAGMTLFGPTSAAARIESSKSFAKDLMIRCGVPTGPAGRFDKYETAATHIAGVSTPIVIKADGLAAGKGVVIAQSRDEAMQALRRIMIEREFGAAGETVLIEEYLEGREVSVFAFVDGDFVSSLTAACDYKRVGDGDIGPNTGGMGSFSPPPFWTLRVGEPCPAGDLGADRARATRDGESFPGHAVCRSHVDGRWAKGRGVQLPTR